MNIGDLQVSRFVVYMNRGFDLFGTELSVLPEEIPPWCCAQVEILRDDEY